MHFFAHTAAYAVLAGLDVPMWQMRTDAESDGATEWLFCDVARLQVAGERL